MEQQKWLQEELTELEQNKKKHQASLAIEDGTTEEFDLVVDVVWEKNISSISGQLQKKIPIKHKGIDKIWYVAVNNPIYRELLERASKGQTHFKVGRLGTAKSTRYKIY